jgi:hypothetical protein
MRTFDACLYLLQNPPPQDHLTHFLERFNDRQAAPHIRDWIKHGDQRKATIKVWIFNVMQIHHESLDNIVAVLARKIPRRSRKPTVVQTDGRKTRKLRLIGALNAEALQKARHVANVIPNTLFDGFCRYIPHASLKRVVQ